MSDVTSTLKWEYFAAMSSSIVRRLVVGGSIVLVLSFPVHGKIKVVAIPPVQQQTLMWCWAAVSEMVLSHYRFTHDKSDGSYQCSIVKSLGGTCRRGCEYCVKGVDTIWHLSTVIRDYQKIGQGGSAQRGKGKFRVIPKKKRLSPKQIIRHIESGNPIIAAISPSGMGYLYPDGMGEHVVVIVGYDDENPSFTILINDPMPFESLGYDPYLAVGGKLTIPGQYWIDYDIFVRSLIYKDSIVFERK